MESCQADVHQAGVQTNYQNYQIDQPRLVQRAETLVMGIEVRTTNQREMNPATAEIPKLWSQFFAEQLWLNLPDCVHPQIRYGIYTDYTHFNSQTYEFAAIAATEVSSIDNPPENMVGVVIPAGAYLVFPVADPSPQSIRQTWQQIWCYFGSSAHQRAFATDFELYESQGVQIFVAVKG